MTLSPKGRKGLIWGAVTLSVVAALSAAALVVTSQPIFCQTCHLMKTRYVSWERSDHHGKAECLDCHAEPGLWGEIKAHVNGARYLYVLVTGRPQVILRAEVPPGTCEQCHPRGEIEDIVEGVSVAHRSHAAADVTCETCHRGFHEEVEGGTLRASLDTCVECHSPTILLGREQAEVAPEARGWSVDGAK